MTPIDAKPMKILITQHAVDRFQERFPELINININIRHSLDKAIPYGATTKNTINLLNNEHNIIFVVQKPELVLMTILTLDLYIANLQSTFQQTTNIPFSTKKIDIKQLAINYKNNKLPNKTNMMHKHSISETQYNEFLEEHKKITKEPKNFKTPAIKCAKIEIIKQFAIEYAIEQNMITIPWSKENDKLIAKRYGISPKKMIHFWGEYYNFIKKEKES